MSRKRAFWLPLVGLAVLAALGPAATTRAARRAAPALVKLIASDAAPGDLFGWQVAISGSTAIVGAMGKSGVGRAYVFVQAGGGWSQQAELTASTAPPETASRATRVCGSRARRPSSAHPCTAP